MFRIGPGRTLPEKYFVTCCLNERLIHCMKIMKTNIRGLNNCLYLLVAGLLLTALPASAQFEHKLSITGSGGLFKNIGKSDYPAPNDMVEPTIPYLMPHYEMGYLLNGGFQYNLNRNISFGVKAGYLRSAYWWYDIYDENEDDIYNFLGWIIWDPVTGDAVVEDADYYTLNVLQYGLTAKYYLIPWKKFHPYVYAGFNRNHITVRFFDKQYESFQNLGRGDEHPEDNSWTLLDNYISYGLSVGTGLEYTLSDRLRFYLLAVNTTVWIEDKGLYERVEVANMNTLSLELGVRFSFLKSKQF